VSMPTPPARHGILSHSTQPHQNIVHVNRDAHRAPAPIQSSATLGVRPPSSTPNAASPPAQESRPGAYAVTRQASNGASQVFRVIVPPGVSPGSEFSVHAGNRTVRVRCPQTSLPGQSLQITLPADPVVIQHLLHSAPLTAPDEESVGGGAVQMNENALQVNSDPRQNQPTFLVTIPQNIHPGMQFTVNVNQQRFMVTCPSNAGPGMSVRIVPPPPRQENEPPPPKVQVFEVVVPPGVRPNQPFTLIANGQRVLVMCPPNAVPGQTIRFQLPVKQAVERLKLSYEGDKAGGWCRTVRVTDMKFQWIRVNHENVEEQSRFDRKSSAYVRNLTFLEGNDARLRTGKLTMENASEAVVDSRLIHKGREIVSYADIASIQTKAFEEKTAWFLDVCKQLRGDWHEDGHIRIVVRRRHLLHDSVQALMSLSREDMRRIWRFEFLGEPGLDAGGLAREWFELVSEQIFDPDRGLWLSSNSNQMCMTINTASAISCPDDHLIYFRFLGRVMGKALYDQRLVKGHMVRHMYKHLLGWPITFEDLELDDPEYYNSLKKLAKMEDVSLMCLDFTATEETMGVRNEVELIKGGSMMEVNNDNLPEYLEANLKYRMLERVRPQLSELLLGFFDVMPEPILTVFDFQELELLMCGLPEIDMDDWMENTIYSGTFESSRSDHPACVWFWEVVRDDFDREMKARLLQFVTGTSGVPSRGFSVLQGNDGNIKKFAINGVDVSNFPYPRAHTCFNRIDLPNYSTKEELRDRLKLAVTMSATGFDME